MYQCGAWSDTWSNAWVNSLILNQFNSLSSFNSASVTTQPVPITSPFSNSSSNSSILHPTKHHTVKDDKVAESIASQSLAFFAILVVLCELSHKQFLNAKTWQKSMYSFRTLSALKLINPYRNVLIYIVFNKNVFRSLLSVMCILLITFFINKKVHFIPEALAIMVIGKLSNIISKFNMWNDDIPIYAFNLKFALSTQRLARGEIYHSFSRIL